MTQVVFTLYNSYVHSKDLQLKTGAEADPENESVKKTQLAQVLEIFKL